MGFLGTRHFTYRHNTSCYKGACRIPEYFDNASGSRIPRNKSLLLLFCRNCTFFSERQLTITKTVIMSTVFVCTYHQITTIFFAGTSVTSHRAPMLSAAQFFVARVATRRHFLRAREHHLLFATETRSKGALVAIVTIFGSNTYLASVRGQGPQSPAWQICKED